MVAVVAGNPFTTYVGQGLFLDPTSNGLVQGTAYPDPATNFQLRRGWLSSTETIPMWGGVAIYEWVPGVTGSPLQNYGVQVGRATTLTGSTKPIAGFSVFDGAYAMVNNPSSPVPLAPSYATVHSYRLGSGARLAVGCDPGLVSLFGTTITGPPVTWDLVNQILIPAVGATAITSGVYTSGTGLVTLTMASPVNLSPGDSVTVSAATGTGSFALINGTFTAGAGTTGSTVTYTIATGQTLTITGGSLTTGAALAVSVLEVQASNCATVNYASSTNTASWNFNGACAVIQI